jgi:hypothetical protein
VSLCGARSDPNDSYGEKNPPLDCPSKMRRHTTTPPDWIGAH